MVDGGDGCHDVDNQTAFSQIGLGRMVDGGGGDGDGDCGDGDDVDKRIDRFYLRWDLREW